MDPVRTAAAAASKKTSVPEWLNSSLWSSSSSSSPSTKSSQISPSPASSRSFKNVPPPPSKETRASPSPSPSPSPEQSVSTTSRSIRSFNAPYSPKEERTSHSHAGSVPSISGPLTVPTAPPFASVNAAVFPPDSSISEDESASVSADAVFPSPLPVASQQVAPVSDSISFPPVSEKSPVFGNNNIRSAPRNSVIPSVSGSFQPANGAVSNRDRERGYISPIREQTMSKGEANPAETEEPADLFNSEAPLSSPLPSTFFTSSVSRSISFDSRVTQFNAEISKKVISISELQRLSSQGIPDSGNIRALTWKLLLGYLPKNRDLWSTELEKKRAEYAAFKEELLVTPSEITRGSEEEALDISNHESQGPLQRHDITQADHPLNLGKTSIWHQFFVDSEVWEQIDRDVKRTHPDMHFFCGDSTSSLENQEAMKRVLFIFSKLNSGIRYVQGMNEVLAPLYYVFRNDELDPANAEADSFFCFVSLLGDFRDHFVQQLDNSAVGIRATISRLNGLLKKQDEELWRHLEHSSKVNPQFYAFRWITLLLTQEFDFADSLRLWDSLLANPEGPLEILLRVCCAMLMSVRSRLLAGDFTSNLKLLQHYPSIDIHHLLKVADNLKKNTYFLDD